MRKLSEEVKTTKTPMPHIGIDPATGQPYEDEQPPAEVVEVDAEASTISGIAGESAAALEHLKEVEFQLKTLPQSVQDRLHHAHLRVGLESLELLAKHYANHSNL